MPAALPRHPEEGDRYARTPPSQDPLPPRKLLRLARLSDEFGDDLKRLAVIYVSDARSAGASWADVGEAFDVTRQAAHQRFKTAGNLRRGRDEAPLRGC